jgi:VanZ family protein
MAKLDRSILLYIFPLLLVVTIFFVSGTSRLATPDLGFTFSKDKIGHFLVFGLVATAILRTPRLRKAGVKGAIIAVLLTSLYGAFDEFRQSMTPGRAVEFADWLADSIGAVVAVVVYLRWHAYRRLLEYRWPKRDSERRQT